MASNSKRKLNSSGSRTPQPTPRRSSAGKSPASGAGRSSSRTSASVARPARSKGASLGSSRPQKSTSRPSAGFKKPTSSKNSAIGKKLSPSSTSSVDKRSIASRMGNPIGDSLKKTSAQGKAVSSKLSSVAQKVSAISFDGVAGTIGKIAAGVVGLMVVGLIAFALIVGSGVFAATDVTFVSTKHVDAASMQRMVKLDEKKSLLSVSKSEILEQLQSNPWIRDVSIERHFPHSLVVTPVEREVFAIAYVNTTNVAWAIGDDDCWIAPVSLSTVVEEDPASSDQDAAAEPQPDASSDDAAANDGGDETPQNLVNTSLDAQQRGGESGSADEADGQDQPLNLDGLEGYEAALAVARDMGAVLLTDCGTDIDPQPGKPVAGGGVLNALTFAHEFSASFMENVRSFSATNVESTSLYLESGVEVALGKADKISYKERATLAVLEQDSSVVYINVRTPESPTWRSVTI